MNILKDMLRGFILAVLIGAVLLGVLTVWLMIGDQKNERIAREIIDPKAAAYLAEQYPGNDFDIQESYNVFKDNCFRVKVQSRSSEDTYFELDYDYKSYELVRDSYESSVLSGRNTRERLVEGYRQMVREQLEPMEGLLYWNADYCSHSENESRDLHFSPDGLDRTTLILDHPYDVAAMGGQYGYLDLTFLEDEEQINLQRAYELLLEADRLLTERGIGWYAAEIRLQNGEYPNDTVNFYLYGVRKADLTAEDPLSRLQELWDEQEANRQRIKAQREHDS